MKIVVEVAEVADHAFVVVEAFEGLLFALPILSITGFEGLDSKVIDLSSC
jgi:hypothetical protein